MSLKLTRQNRRTQLNLSLTMNHLFKMIDHIFPLVELHEANGAMGCLNKKTNRVLNTMTFKHVQAILLLRIHCLATNVTRVRRIHNINRSVNPMRGNISEGCLAGIVSLALV